MKTVILLFVVALLPMAGQAQMYRSSQTAVGGGGNSVYISTDEQIAAQKAAAKERARLAAIPEGMTPKMIWLERGKVMQRQKEADGTTLLWLTYIKRMPDSVEEGCYVVAGHPDADNLAVNENAPCIVVPGPVRDDLGGERLYYFFDKKEVSESTLAAFRAKYPDAPLD